MTGPGLDNMVILLPWDLSVIGLGLSMQPPLFFFMQPIFNQ